MSSQKMKHHFLFDFLLPKKELRTSKDAICMHLESTTNNQTRLVCDHRHLNGCIFSGMKLEKDERAVILSIEMTYCANDTQRDVYLYIEDLFSVDTRQLNHDDNKPDKTGRVRFHLPAGCNGPVPKKHRLIYQPNFTNLGIDILPYVGMEEYILNVRSQAVSTEPEAVTSLSSSLKKKDDGFEIFCQTDPIIVFILRERGKLTSLMKEANCIVMLKDEKHYKVKKSLLEKVRYLFASSIFPLFHYTTRDNHIHLAWQSQMQPPPPLPPHMLETKEMEEKEAGTTGFAMMVFMLKVTFIVVPVGLSKIEAVMQKLSI